MKLSELIEILETLEEQGFIEFSKDSVTKEIATLLGNLWILDIIDKPREVPGAYGAILLSPDRLYALKQFLKFIK